MTRYIGKQPAFGNFVKLDAISVVNGQAAYTMQSGSSNFTNYDNVNQFIVSLNGLIQNPGTSFSVSGSTITFASGLSTGDVINFILVLGDVLSVGTPSDNTVSTAKIQNTAVNADKLATDAVQTAKIQDDAVTKSKTDFITDGSSAGVTVKGSGSDSGSIALNCSSNSHAIQLISPDHSAGQSYKLKLMDNNVTAGKFLKVKSITGSGATATGQLEFADISGGGLVHLNTTVASSSSNVSFNSSILNSTYNAYKIFISGMRGSSDNNHVEVYYSFDNGSSYESSNYMFSSTGRDSDGNEVHAHTGTASKIEITANTAGYDTDEGFNAELTLFNPSQTTRHKILAFNSYFFKTNGHIQRVLGIGTNDGSSSAVNNIKIQFQSGNIAEGQFSIFGVANS
jgi:hypothetical protein|tara:strand:+ start:2242 stop:3432 length:1191 start_codon:yes stop_codon:yes gene_type:complete